MAKLLHFVPSADELTFSLRGRKAAAVQAVQSSPVPSCLREDLAVYMNHEPHVHFLWRPRTLIIIIIIIIITII